MNLVKKFSRKRFEDTISDGVFNDIKEKAVRSDFASRIALPGEIADTISADLRKDYVKRFVVKIIDEERFSPDEEKKLEDLKRNLNVDFKFDDQLRWKMQKLKLYWELENLPLPVILPGIIFQKNEICHLQILSVQWYELRTVRQRVGYTGYSTSIRIAKGFYLRSGSYTPRTYTSEQMKLINSGTLYLTNKRIIFDGNAKNSNIRLEKIISFTPYNDGVEISK